MRFGQSSFTKSIEEAHSPSIGPRNLQTRPIAGMLDPLCNRLSAGSRTDKTVLQALIPSVQALFAFSAVELFSVGYLQLQAWA